MPQNFRQGTELQSVHVCDFDPTIPPGVPLGTPNMLLIRTDTNDIYYFKGPLDTDWGVLGNGVSGVNIADEGIPLPGNPHTTIDFVGPGVTAVDAGGGVANITIPGGGGNSAVIFDDAIPANKVNIRSDRASNQSPIDNTKAGITNLGSDTGTFPATGATGNYSTIGGGDDNTAGDYSVVAGGRGNSAPGESDAICGGSQNTIVGFGNNFIGGGDTNTINNVGNAFANVITGGDFNEIDGEYGNVIAGGAGHVIDSASDECCIGGGDGNFINGGFASGIASGENNLINEADSFIGGGADHTINSFNSVVCGGGSHNISANGDFSAIVGGDNNGVGTFGGDCDNAFVGAGRQNHIDGDFDSIVGGANNLINNELNGSTHSIIGGGEGNEINSGNFNVIAGGQRGDLHGFHSAISGGRDNTLTGSYGSIAGGDNNRILLDANYCSIPGGRNNIVSEDYGSASGFNNEVPVGAFYGHASGIHARAWLEGSRALSSGDNPLPATNGRWQLIEETGRFGPANAPIGANQHFSFGQTFTAITLPDNKAYAIRARCSAAGAAGAQCAIIVEEMIVRKLAGVVTVIEQLQVLALGTATAKANWTVIGVAAGATLFIDFSSGADILTANISATVHLEIVEVPIF